MQSECDELFLKRKEKEEKKKKGKKEKRKRKSKVVNLIEPSASHV